MNIKLLMVIHARATQYYTYLKWQTNLIQTRATLQKCHSQWYINSHILRDAACQKAKSKTILRIFIGCQLIFLSNLWPMINGFSITWFDLFKDSAFFTRICSPLSLLSLDFSSFCARKGLFPYLCLFWARQAKSQWTKKKTEKQDKIIMKNRNWALFRFICPCYFHEYLKAIFS